MAKFTWLGHAAWIVEASGKKILIDPFIDGNPSSPVKSSDIKGIDYVFVTHNHSDHFGDSVKIANANNAKFVSVFETAEEAKRKGLKESLSVGMNAGTLVPIDNIHVAITFALHSGNPSGFIIKAGNLTLYHAGDTGLFSDMKLIGELYRPDVAMLPIGGFFTMGPREAATAAQWLGAKVVLPMHFNTFPAIRQRPEELKELLAGKAEVPMLKPGESYTYG
ncbi:metal-dependent hydrolase [Candidatus Marsarchaeota archaeon]|nr:metal-dependent hydrolase [Candidatus Marsarchaeota archaeon]MCL5404469.1 metal-dependent hydrolase [Candidatus Marsarchaeota archaeon]